MATRDAFDPAQMGTDLRLVYRQSGGFFEDADVFAARRDGGVPGSQDLATTDGVENLTQAIANRLKTRKGELRALGHPSYGSRHHELMGEPNVERTRNLIKLYVLQALRREPRIEKVLSLTVRAEHQPPRDTVRIEIAAMPIRATTPINLVVPFALGVLADDTDGGQA